MASLPGGSGSSAMRRDPAWPGAFGALMLLGFGLGSLPVFLGVLNHDVAWYLHAAGRVLAGDRLYVDIIETNPPLIIWLSFAPRFLARTSGISEILALRVLMLGLVGFSLLVTRSTLIRALPERPGARRSLLLLSLFILIPLAGYDFAQREHLMLALFLPYLVMASGRATGRHPTGGLPWVVGLMAGVGLALKPHFVLPWLAIEAYLAAACRGWRPWSRPEALAVAAVGLAYAVAVAAITPEYLPLMGWAGPVYSASGRSSFSASWDEPGTVVTVVALLGFMALRPRGDGRERLELILVADLGFLAIALLQNKGYTYHFYPPLALGVLLVGLLAVGSPGPPALRPGVALVMMRGTLLALVLSIAVARVNESLGWRGRPGESDTTLGRMIRVVEDHAGGGAVFTFSPAVGASFPMITYGGVEWASRHPALWFLPAYHPEGFDDNRGIAHRPPRAMGETERFLFDSVVDELLASRPTLLFVDETEQPRAFNGRRFRYLDYYSLDPRFAEFLRDYETLTRVDDFRVYRRRGRTSRPSANIPSPRRSNLPGPSSSRGSPPWC